ncbi:MAG: hypothetical protein R3F59_18500 [Myxococcota bacterium]
MVDPGLRERRVHREQVVVVGRIGGAHLQRLDPARLLERREQRALALVAEQRGDVVDGAHRPHVVLGRQGELQLDLPPDLERYHVDPHPELVGTERRRPHHGLLAHRRPRRHARQPVGDHRLQRVEGLAADHRDRHPVCAVRALVQPPQVVVDLVVAPIRERLEVPHRELALRVVGVRRGLAHLPRPPPVVLLLERVLAVDGVALALDVLRVELRRDEELGEAVERAGEGALLDLEEVGGGLAAGAGVGHPAVILDEPPVLLHVGVLVGAHEEHVLEEVGEAWRSCGSA